MEATISKLCCVPIIAFILLLSLTGVTTDNACASEISLSSSTNLSREGYFVLSWHPDTHTEITLQQSRSPEFSEPSTKSVSNTNAITITGLNNGHWHFRVGNSQLGWSNIVSVEVQHHSLSKAWGFFVVGLLLFVVLCITIFLGARSSDRVAL